MTLETDSNMQTQIAGWITEALSAGESKVETLVRKMADAEAQGIWGRVRALEGALRKAKAGHPIAPSAVAMLCNRIQLIASVYDLVEVRGAAAAIARSVSGTSIGFSIEADMALALLVDMANKATVTADQRVRAAA
jgi:hypothetical protein